MGEQLKANHLTTVLWIGLKQQKYEKVYELIASERQPTKTGGKSENGRKKVKDQKVRDKKDKEGTEIKEFIASICGEANISDTTKRDIKIYYDVENEQEL